MQHFRDNREVIVLARPRKYQTVAKMERAIDDYFKNCEGQPLTDKDGTVLTDKHGYPVIVGEHPPTVTGMALALGFTGRQALMDYQARPEFTDTITRAKSRCEAYAEERLYDRDGANGAKFSLSCNFGWRDGRDDGGGSGVKVELGEMEEYSV